MQPGRSGRGTRQEAAARLDRAPPDVRIRERSPAKRGLVGTPTAPFHRQGCAPGREETNVVTIRNKAIAQGAGRNGMPGRRARSREALIEGLEGRCLPSAVSPNPSLLFALPEAYEGTAEISSSSTARPAESRQLDGGNGQRPGQLDTLSQTGRYGPSPCNGRPDASGRRFHQAAQPRGAQSEGTPGPPPPGVPEQRHGTDRPGRLRPWGRPGGHVGTRRRRVRSRKCKLPHRLGSGRNHDVHPIPGPSIRLARRAGRPGRRRVRLVDDGHDAAGYGSTRLRPGRKIPGRRPEIPE